MVDAGKVVELAFLLERALQVAVVEGQGHHFPVSLELYKVLVESSRRFSTRNVSFPPEMFLVRVEDEELSSRLDGVVRAGVSPYLHEGNLQSAGIVTGGAVAGYSLEDLVSHLLTVALLRGGEYAARSFYDCLESEAVLVQALFLIEGVAVHSSIEIDDGIRLEPVPSTTEAFPPYLVRRGFSNPLDLFGRTVLVIDQKVSPVFANPAEMRGERSTAPFKREGVSSAYPDLDVGQFCEAISLAIDHYVTCVAWWSYGDRDGAFMLGHGNGSGGSSSEMPRHGGRSSWVIQREDVGRAEEVYGLYRGLDSATALRLRVPIGRWMRAKADEHLVDKFINLGTAMESLFLGDEGYNGELKFRLALRAGWYLAEDSRERRELVREFGRIYAARSRAVHTGKVSERDGDPGFVANSQDLCRRAIVKVMKAGQFPDWEELVVGG